MSCPALNLSESSGFATALDMIDCRSGQAIASGFARLFGSDGAMLPALTILLTLYVAIFAIGLLTGRSRLGLATLTPRMLTLGMALTFATSWAAYQNVVWTLAAGAPDQIASLMIGSRGSATHLFAKGLDHIFRAIAAAAQDQQAQAPAQLSKNPDALPGAGMVSGTSLLWLSAIILLMGTVGTLITAKIALAGLVAVGPLFVVLALFRSTWGLFEGWLKALVILMMIPLFVVLIGGGALVMIAPIISGAISGPGDDTGRAAMMLFLAACIYSALLVIVIKMASTIVRGWRLPFAAQSQAGVSHVEPRGWGGTQAQAPLHAQRSPPSVRDDRVRSMLSGLPSPTAIDRRSATITSTITRSDRTVASAPRASAAATPHRALDIGRRFRASAHAIDKDRP